MQRVRRALATATVVLIMGSAGAAAATADGSGRAGPQQRLDEVVDHGSVGGLALVRTPHDAWRGTSGVSKLGSDRPVPGNSRFRAGSITKTFLATVVLQLTAEGKLGLEDSVESWLPGVVPGGEGITLRQLMNHTSGVPDYRPTIPLPPSQEFLDNRERTWTAAELIARAVTQPPTSDPPGKTFSYSNTNYLLLGQIVEKATGHSYAEEIERRLIRPLHLRDTTMPGTSVEIPGPHPHGYAPLVRDGESEMTLVDFTRMNPSLFGASGEIISTAPDLDAFFRALLGGRLLPAHLLKEMERPAVEGHAYGLGLAWRDTPCHVRVYGNDGDAVSYQSWSYVSADTRRGVTIALTPNHSANSDTAVGSYIDAAICGDR
ncbi:serine hydrolase domain-containing protein [Luteipulveratus mongoliensis]|uniref:Beta-lactamase-related domain-containing protein n=1 Tax=Luteipulveratus mongoliensis TaxID=571913 RepID=A0A0K1JLJ8_9MICO|nr:serine hydrolase domain-containing protein [Luteipulveratus mongoliensis]AKU17450.1 hypothetical protein VV02_19035 [Luteipulveratus mongoliensis]